MLADPAFTSRLADYRVMRDRVRADAGRRRPVHRRAPGSRPQKLDLIAAELLAFVNEPLTELEAQTQGLPTADQMRAGPPPLPPARPVFSIGW